MLGVPREGLADVFHSVLWGGTAEEYRACFPGKETEASGAFNDWLEVTWEVGGGTGQDTCLPNIK